jgi:predicted transglutaminase-like cysteine proteinase
MSIETDRYKKTADRIVRETNIALLTQINTTVNQIPYNAIAGAHEPADWWTDVPVSGQSFECRDYTLTKAEQLRNAGFPVGDMTVVLLWTEPEPPTPGAAPERLYHAVLACNVSGDIYILDNRWPNVYIWNSPPYDYQWAEQQISGTVDFRDVSQTGLS